ncbi:MAG: hypothetical protein EOO03_02355 [Chitinophagaceae bacterium]|nr:MAG: hypothetical protein EOO03_02355 [Chitinophagaceae bacterium]
MTYHSFNRAGKLLVVIVFVCIGATRVVAQDSSNFVTLPASGKYHKSKFYRSMFGEHYRKEWHTPVTFRKAMLDTLRGGVQPYKAGGGRQTLSLRLRDKNDREYVLRSIDKTLSGALPEIAKGTFLESITNDQVTFAHPYAANIAAPLAQAAGIYHSNPTLYFIPAQPALGKYNDSFGNKLYLFEQRADENWSSALNFGNSKNIVGTEKMFEKIWEDNDNVVDQQAFVKARLFDMLLGDWGRHEDQWRWASFKDDKRTKFVPVPRDRDNAFSVFDGALLKLLLKVADADHMQSFGSTIKDVNSFNSPAKNLDRRLLTALTLQQWMQAADELQQALTDKVIDDAVAHLPKEIYPISGPGIAAKLKTRVKHLDSYAKDYYSYLATEVDVTGTEDDDFFEINRVNDTATAVNIFKISNKGKKADMPFFSRVFNNRETNEIRLYGIDGKDEYKVSGDVNKSITLRLIGGPGNDKFVDESKVRSGRKKTLLYDSEENNDISKSEETRLHLSNDSAVHRYVYDHFKPNKSGWRPTAFYSFEDRFYVGVVHKYERQDWRKEPFGVQRKFSVKYSLGQKAFSSTYSIIHRGLLGKWDGNLYANWDQVRWHNFYGLGNETLLGNRERDFNRVRSRQFIAKLGVQRVIKNRHRFVLNPYFQSYDVINDTARFLAKVASLQVPSTYNTHSYGGAEIQYVYQNINDSIYPTKGFALLTEANLAHNLGESGRNVNRFRAEMNTFLPISRRLGFMIRAGGATLTGEPEFFQYNTLGSSETLRGHQRDRFYGNSTVFNQNEIRWMHDVRSKLYNGKLTFFGLYDVGRVWLKSEASNKWHYGYGAGIMLSPFNRITVSAAYAISAEDKNLHFNVIKAL